MIHDDSAAACAAYFRQNPAYERMMAEMLKKYRGLGRVGGTICLADASAEERDAARALFGWTFAPPLRIGLREFEAALQETRFHGITLPALLAAYYDKAIQTKEELRHEKERLWHEMIEAARSAERSQVCRKWLEELSENRDNKFQSVRSLLQAEPDAASLRVACDGVDWLEGHQGSTARLAVLSAYVTADPHAFDSNKLAGKLLLHLLAYRARAPLPATAEERDALFFQSGIVCDSISSTVTQIGLVLGSNGEEHPASCAFRRRHEINTLSLTNLAALTFACSPSGRAYLVENQMLFSQLCDNAEQFHSPLICTSGQLQVAVLRLLDLLVEAGVKLFYSGDFDVEGLSIAARLQARYPNMLTLWHMEAEDYMACRSGNPLDQAKLQGLRSLPEGSLKQTAAAMQTYGVAGYQELLLEQLRLDLTETP